MGRLELTKKRRMWNPSWSTEEGPVRRKARRSQHLQSPLNTRRIESFSFYGVVMNVNSNYSAVLSMRIFQSYNTMVIPINNFRCHDMADQEEARGFLDSVSEAGSDES